MNKELIQKSGVLEKRKTLASIDLIVCTEDEVYAVSQKLKMYCRLIVGLLDVDQTLLFLKHLSDYTLSGSLETLRGIPVKTLDSAEFRALVKNHTQLMPICISHESKK